MSVVWGPRNISVLVVSCLTYIFALHFLLWGATHIATAGAMVGYIYWLCYIATLIAVITLVAIEFHRIRKSFWYILFLILFTISSSIGILSGGNVIYTLLLLSLFHGGILLLILSKIQILSLYRRIYIQDIIQKGVRNFVAFVSLCICLMVAHGRQSTNINCEKLYMLFHHVGNVIGWSGTGESLAQFSDASVADILGIDATRIDDVLSQVGEINLDILLSGNNMNEDLSHPSLLTTWKHFLTKEITEDKDIINQGFCSLIVEQIEKKQRSPLFFYSTTILLFFLLFPLLKLLFWVTDFLTYIFFHVLFLLGIYKKTSVVGDIETIV